MAADPTGDAGKNGIWEAPGDVPEWVTLPSGIVKTDVGKVWYAQYHTRNDGTVDIEWYKRGNRGEGATDPIDQRSQATNPAVKKAWDEAQQTAANNPRQTPQPLPSGASPTQNRNGRIYGYNPQTGLYDIDQGEAAATQTPQEIREEAERRKNAALPPNQDPRPETDAARAARADATIKAQGEAARQAEIDRQNAANTAADNKRADEAAAATRAAQNRPGAPTLSPDGKGGTIAVQAMPDGSIKTTPLPNVPTDAKSITVGGIVYEKGPDGTYAPAAGIPLPGTQPGQAEPAGAPPLGANPQEIAAGLQTYSTWLADQVRLYQSSGGKQGMAPDAATKAMESRIKVADAVVTQQNNTVTTQSTQRGQDITQRGQTIQDTSGRRTSAQAIYDTALSQFMPMIAHAGKGNGGLVISAMQEALNNARDYVGSYGGLKDSPEIGTAQFPALDQARQASLATLQQATNPPQPMQPQPVTGPAPDANAAAAEAARQQQTAANPVFRPAPPVSATPPTPAAVNPVSQQAITVPQTPDVTPPPPPLSEQPRDNNGPDYPGQQTPVNPLPGEPGSNPGAPVGMAPPQQPAFMTQARAMGQGYDPSGIVQKLLDDPTTDNSVLAAAYQQMYGRPLTPPQTTLPLLV